MKKCTKILTVGMLVLSMIASTSYGVSAAPKAKLAKKKLSITEGNKKSIKIKNKKKNKKYIFSTNKKKVASVTKKGVVKAKKKGNAVITVKEKNKKGKSKARLVGKVKVKVTEMITNKPIINVTPQPTNNMQNNNPVNPTNPPQTEKGADIYVSASGNDNGDGSKSNPYRTLSKAKEAVRSMDKTKGDIVVEFADGFYPVNDTIEFTSADSGNDKCTIYYRAASGASPVISGGKKIEGTWQVADDVDWLSGSLKAYKIPLVRDKKLRALYVNGERASMTSKVIKPVGSIGSYSVTKGQADWAWHSRSGMSAGTKFAADCPLSADTRNPHNIELDSSSRWARQVVCVDYLNKAADGTVEAYLQMPYGAFAQNLGWNTAYTAASDNTVTNVFEWLSNPGEFYFDEEGSMLYYIPREGEDINNAEVVVPELDTIIEMKGDNPQEKYVEDIVFDGIEFAYSDWNLQEIDGSHGYASVQGAIVLNAFGLENQHDDIYRTYDIPAAAIHVNSARNVKFLNGAIRHTGNIGIHLENDVNDIDVTGNYIGKTSGAGVVVGHPTHVYENDGPEHQTKAADAAGPDKEKFADGTEKVPTNITVSNNYLLENCYFFSGHSPITTFYTYNLQVLHNFVYKCSYSGMSIGWGWCNFDGVQGSDSQLPGYPTHTSKNNHVNYNRVEEICSLLQDAGGIYTLGQQGNDDWTEYSEMSFNYINAKRTPQVADGSRMVNGFHPDEGSAYIKFDSNVITNTIRNVYELNDWRRKHDMIVTNGFSNTDRSECTAPNCTLEQYVNSDYIWPLKGYETVLYSGLEDEYVYMVGKDVMPDTDYELASNVRLSAGQKLPRRGLLSADDTVWLAPTGTGNFAVSDTMTCAKGNEKSIDIPAAPGEYKLYIVYSDGSVSDESTFTLYIGESSDIANVSDGQNVNVSKLRPLVLELKDGQSFTLNNKSVSSGYEISTSGTWTLKSGNDTITFTTTVTEANRILSDNVTVGSGEEFEFTEVLSDPEKTIWLAPSGLSAFDENDPTMSKTAGNSYYMAAPKQPGKYILTIVDAKGDILSQSDAFVTVQ